MSVDVTVPNAVSLEEIKTPEITVILEELTTVSKPVTVEFIGTAADGMEASLIDAAPSQVEVKGAESVVAKVDTVRVQVDVAELTETADIFYEVPSAWTKKGKLIKDVSVSANSLEIQAVLHQTKVVELELKVTGSPDGDAEVTVPGEVTVKGAAGTLARITSISAESVDIDGISETTVIPVKMTMPYGIQVEQWVDENPVA